MFLRQCPSCRSLDVHRSSEYGAGELKRSLFLSPYRCRNCNARFRVVSKRLCSFFGVMGLVTLPAIAVLATIYTALG